jgi:hypothetical protein
VVNTHCTGSLAHEAGLLSQLASHEATFGSSWNTPPPASTTSQVVLALQLHQRALTVTVVFGASVHEEGCKARSGVMLQSLFDAHPGASRAPAASTAKRAALRMARVMEVSSVKV